MKLLFLQNRPLHRRLRLAFNATVKSGELTAFIVIGRDHLDNGSVASPNREAAGMQDRSGAVIVCDGTDDAARRIERVLWNDPATSVIRHADAGADAGRDLPRHCGCPGQ